MNRGNLIAELRKEAGFTQKSLAEALHITDKAVSKWERGLSLPDVSLLPKLSLLLDADMDLLLSSNNKHSNEGWMGLLDLRESEVDLHQRVYDKPLVYFLLSHFLLLNIRNICVFCSARNQEYLRSEWFSTLGFSFTFDEASLENHDLMILNRPCFVFGSDLTHQFHGAMVAETVVSLVPENVAPPFLFCPAEFISIYRKNPEYLYEIATERTLGRGMLCLDMDHVDNVTDVASFVKIYQNSSGLLAGSLEEIAYRKGILDKDQLLNFAAAAPCGELLRKLADKPQGD